jgi:hypothetical protein
MAFADPQTVTINAVAQTLPLINREGRKGVFRKDDSTVSLTVSHKEVRGRTNSMLRLDHSKVAADPLLAGVNRRATGSVWLVADFDPSEYTVAERKQIVDALTAYLTASSGARATQLLGGEN